jgi:predicted transcriptional regulator
MRWIKQEINAQLYAVSTSDSVHSSIGTIPYPVWSENISRENVFIQTSTYHYMQKFSDEELIDLHQKGLTDREISEKLGVTQGAVNYRREKLRLKNNYTPETFSNNDLLKLYHQGLSDREIGKALGVTQAAVNYRRGRLGLKSNYIREKTFLDLYHKGLSAEDMAQKLGVNLCAVLHMMEKTAVALEEAAAETKA